MTDDPDSRRLWGPFLAALPVSSVSVAVFDGAGRQSTVGVSDSVAARLDELQLELGVGPRWDVLDGGEPVLVPDLAVSAPPHWAPFASAALELGVRSMFAFPLRLGLATVGVVELAAPKVLLLDPAELATAARLARSITRRAVDQGTSGADDDERAETPAVPAMRREVHQATGMILVQLDVSATEAFARLRAYAFANSRTIQDVAHAVVSRELDFGALPDESASGATSP